MKPGYRPTLKLEIMRAVHELNFFMDNSAGEIKKALKEVPDGAILKGIDDNENEIVLEFIEETPK